jgi:hypothetical protein
MGERKRYSTGTNEEIRRKSVERRKKIVAREVS